MKPSMQARGATDAAVAMGNVICCKVLCREDQKTNGPLKYQNVISDTKTKDQFLPKVLRERISERGSGCLSGEGSLPLGVSLPVRQEAVKKGHQRRTLGYGPWMQLSAVSA